MTIKNKVKMNKRIEEELKKGKYKLKENQLNEEIINALEQYFPKGDKARGRALVLYAIAQIEINKLEAKRKYWENKYKKEIDKHDE